ncbi:large ribosomal subunit protein mL43-like, partial [Stegostoma tigrinum]|uniref:large ribosomal subunit protein mL43-like n=1 Tax=Stegostoma tigrinum TaxID=3053191 RepID=UPI00286FF53E
MTARGTASRFLQSVLQNGVGRYICQLKRVTLVFSKDAPSSRGVREFVEEGVVDFAKRNPGMVVYVAVKRCNVPKLVGEYQEDTDNRPVSDKETKVGEDLEAIMITEEVVLGKLMELRI